MIAIINKKFRQASVYRRANALRQSSIEKGRSGDPNGMDMLIISCQIKIKSENARLKKVILSRKCGHFKKRVKSFLFA